MSQGSWSTMSALGTGVAWRYLHFDLPLCIEVIVGFGQYVQEHFFNFFCNVTHYAVFHLYGPGRPPLV